MSDESDIKRYLDKIDDIIGSENNGMITLNNWEIQFIDSIQVQLIKNKNLSWKQAKSLTKIYEKVINA